MGFYMQIWATSLKNSNLSFVCVCVCVYVHVCVCGSHLLLKQLTSVWETLYELYATGNHPSATIQFNSIQFISCSIDPRGL